MPWWIWLLLVLFMVAMLVIGGVYVFRRGLAALHVITDTGMQVGERLDRMGRPQTDDGPGPVPAFTRPLHETAERYERAQVEVIARRQAKRDRHVRAWRRWRNAF
ncbi:YibE/F family protein [Bifidobacterium platyrrhinorum]|uniref:Uncharacterized protein n=1 Tax=Bifidobacterium platyrrhinorum TaxID=2661628 RepID=A0A6L9ST61_9BIFI|nr:YibE/F family protein [Bifidobacterium platyrrhinorum]NEG54702.1 hypothetical protein [Bifidobacterium platyrrhinorum]